MYNENRYCFVSRMCTSHKNVTVDPFNFNDVMIDTGI